jgi:hypothetical protein
MSAVDKNFFDLSSRIRKSGLSVVHDWVDIMKTMNNSHLEKLRFILDSDRNKTTMSRAVNGFLKQRRNNVLQLVEKPTGEPILCNSPLLVRCWNHLDVNVKFEAYLASIKRDASSLAMLETNCCPNCRMPESPEPVGVTTSDVISAFHNVLADVDRVIDSRDKACREKLDSRKASRVYALAVNHKGELLLMNSADSAHVTRIAYGNEVDRNIAMHFMTEDEIQNPNSFSCAIASEKCRGIVRGQLVKPNRYWFLGGKIESGETPYRALIREIDEELGSSLNYDIGEFTQIDDTIFVRIRLNEPTLQSVMSHEGKVEWVSPDDLTLGSSMMKLHVRTIYRKMFPTIKNSLDVFVSASEN